MRRALVAKQRIRPPKELQRIFDNPPLVGDERREDYEDMLSTLAAAARLADAIAWIYFADVLNLTWEICRMRIIKTEAIKLYQKNAIRFETFVRLWDRNAKALRALESKAESKAQSEADDDYDADAEAKSDAGAEAETEVEIEIDDRAEASEAEAEDLASLTKAYLRGQKGID